MIADILEKLSGLGVSLNVVAGRLRFRAVEGAYTLELRDLVGQHRAEIIAWVTCADLGPTPTEQRARASWLNAIARRAGLDAEALFALIEEHLGRRTIGPFELTVAETEKIATILRADIGTRPPIMPTPAVVAVDLDPAVPASIAKKHALGMSDAAFSRLCKRVIGHHGLRSVEDDHRVFHAMPEPQCTLQEARDGITEIAADLGLAGDAWSDFVREKTGRSLDDLDHAGIDGLVRSIDDHFRERP